jgi:hypothetical protein
MENNMKAWRSYSNKHHAEIVSEYVNKTMNIFARFPTKAREKIEGEKYTNQWVIEIDEYIAPYTVTLEKCDNAATDFLEGYKYATREVMPSLLGETIIKWKQKGE